MRHIAAFLIGSLLLHSISLAQEFAPTPTAETPCAYLNIDSPSLVNFGNLVARADSQIVDASGRNLGLIIVQSPHGSLLCWVLQQKPFELVGCFKRNFWTLTWDRKRSPDVTVRLRAPYWVASLVHQLPTGHIVSDALHNADKKTGVLKLVKAVRNGKKLKIIQRKIGTFQAICK